MNTNRIINLVNPTSNQDAATKLYVDSNAGISQSTADGRYYLNTTTLNNITLPSNNLNINTHRIINVVNPVSA
jgi:hypothetical protein